MIMRWFPNGDDKVTLEQIRQVPGVSGVATMLSFVPAGEIWTPEAINSVKKEVNDAGLEMEVIESVNIHEDIKKGLPTKDHLIENYIKTMKNLSDAGVKCICYNFMPVLDWYRSELYFPLPDGSNCMAYNHAYAQTLTSDMMAKEMIEGSNNLTLPGWEPERFPQMAADIEFYKNVSQDEYFKNIKYFLDAIIPYA